VLSLRNADALAHERRCTLPDMVQQTEWRDCQEVTLYHKRLDSVDVGWSVEKAKNAAAKKVVVSTNQR
jgi:hypothetical protein